MLVGPRRADRSRRLNNRRSLTGISSTVSKHRVEAALTSRALPRARLRHLGSHFRSTLAARATGSEQKGIGSCDAASSECRSASSRARAHLARVVRDHGRARAISPRAELPLSRRAFPCPFLDNSARTRRRPDPITDTSRVPDPSSSGLPPRLDHQVV